MLRIGSAGISGDEAATWWASSLPWPDLARLLDNQDVLFGPYYAVMHGWAMISESLSWLRTFSAIGASLAAVCTSGLARRWFGVVAGWYAPLLLVLCFSWIRFAQEARSYSWSMALAVAATWAFVAASQRLVRGAAVRYLILGTLVPLTHLFAGMIIGVHLIWALTRRKYRLAGLAAVACIPTIVMAALAISQVQQVWWIERLGPLAAAKSLVTFDASWWYAALAVQLLGLAGLLTLAWAARRETQEGSEPGTQARNGTDVPVLLAVWWFLPPVALWIASTATTPVFSARYLLFTTPAAALAASAVLVRIQRKPFGGFAVASCLIVLVAASIPAQAWVRSSSGHWWNSNAFAAVISEKQQPKDALVAREWGVRLPVIYSLQSDPLPEPLIVESMNEVELYAPVHARPEDEPRLLDGFDRVWLLSAPGRVGSEVPQGFCSEQEWVSEFHLAKLELASRC